MDKAVVAALRARLDAVTIRDSSRLARRIDESVGRARRGQPFDLAALSTEIEVAEARLAERRASIPPVRYPADLPITARRDDIAAAIEAHQVVIVAGETGSGKSTQLPKLCLELGRGVRGLIGHTQPRRVAARTVAERVAEELGGEVGGTVGYAVRFTDRVGDRSAIKVMTDGILLAETQRDRQLLAYDTIIVDEAHERSLNVDFLLGYLTQLLPRRPDLKLIVTSATIDTERFAAHFGGAPVIEVSGRTYPVELRYRPIGDDPADDRDQVQAVCDAVEELSAEGPGDVLVFLSGEREIHDTADALRRSDLRNTEVLPLYARLSSAEQHRIFEPHTGRRVVLATNVAETSITVPGVRYVVDAGTARISRYNRRLKVQRLPIEAISQASANQRAGRCGRVAPGICIRLYDAEDFADRPEFTEPEMLRTNLASVILQMHALGLGDIEAFPFVEAPDRRAVRDGIALLEELGALAIDEPDPRKRLTALGRQLAQLPLDPRLGRMVLESQRLGCTREVLIITAAMSIVDPRERPADKAGAADELHRRFTGDGSDFIAFVRLWDHLRARQSELSSNQFRKLCRSEFLNYLRVREWQDLYSQLRQVTSQLGLTVDRSEAPVDHVHQALLSGLLSHIGMREEPTTKPAAKAAGKADQPRRKPATEFRGARNARFTIAGASSLAKAPPRWVMAGELVETNRLWARVCGRIQPEWAERLGEHLVQRTYAEPRWDPDRGAAIAIERATLYGLPIVAGRTVNLSRVDPDLARDMFIRHALVDGEWETHHAFWFANRELVDQVTEMVERTRRGDLLVDHEHLFARYDALIPDEVVSARHFDKWWNSVRRTQPDLLTFRAEDLWRSADGPDLDGHPDHWTQGELTFRVTYEFEPGSATDGVMVHVPVAVLNRVTTDGFDWQVPGRRAELVAALIRTLPKPIRRSLVPVNEFAAAALERIDPSMGALVPTLVSVLAPMGAVAVRPDDVDLSLVPPELRITFAAVDDDDTVLDRDKDLHALRTRMRGHTRAAIVAASPGLERTGCRHWEFGTLPEVVEVARSGYVVRGYPTLVDEGDTVGVRLLTDPALQAGSMRAATRRLLLLTVAPGRGQLAKRLPRDVTLSLARMGMSPADLVDDCIVASTDRLIAEAGGPAWDEAGFEALERSAAATLPERISAAVGLAGQAVATAAAVTARIERLGAPAMSEAVADAADQLARLVRPGFVTSSGSARLPDIVRYLAALDRRLDKLPTEIERDRHRMQQVRGLEQRYITLLDRYGNRPLPQEVVDAGWMLEELRVSVFAQVLGTAYPISEQRVLKELSRLAGQV